jgi:hypothetical protein
LQFTLIEQQGRDRFSAHREALQQQIAMTFGIPVAILTHPSTPDGATTVVTFDRYVVHEAGEVQADGTQSCARCGFVILDAAPPDADSNLWGFGLGRRIVQGPHCTYLVTVDRQLAPDEVPCR